MFDIIKAKKLVLDRGASEKLMTWLIGLYPEPYLKGVQAEVDAERLRQQASDLTDMPERRRRMDALNREERIWTIGAKAADKINDDAAPDKVDTRWRSLFVDHAEHITTEDLQELWARILASEVNSPGSVSIQTMQIASTMGREHAEKFVQLCRFHWRSVPKRDWVIAYFAEPYKDFDHDVTEYYGVTREDTFDIASLGLCVVGKHYYGADSEFGNEVTLRHDDEVVVVKQISGLVYEPFALPVGSVWLTKAGTELASILDLDPVEGFADRCIHYWRVTHDGECEFLRRAAPP